MAVKYTLYPNSLNSIVTLGCYVSNISLPLTMAERTIGDIDSVTTPIGVPLETCNEEGMTRSTKNPYGNTIRVGTAGEISDFLFAINGKLNSNDSAVVAYLDTISSDTPVVVYPH
jgi:hypothetical protein